MTEGRNWSAPCYSDADVSHLLGEQSNQLHEKTQRGAWNNNAHPYERQMIKALRAQMDALSQYLTCKPQ